MAEPVHELRVFLASPGDLVNEREVVQQVEKRVNAIFDRQKIRVRITGWEQVSPELGRPQHLINPLAHECDIFIGLLNRRWGSDTGEYSSGFEEEFKTVVARRTSGPEPAIGMFFAEIPAEFRSDPGPQLQTVLAFQEHVRNQHVALYKTFRNADHLGVEILEFLTAHILRTFGLTIRDGSGAKFDPPELSNGVDAQGQATLSASNDVEASEALGSSEEPTPTSRQPDAAQSQIAQALYRVASWFEESGSRLIDTSDHDRVKLVGTAFGHDDETIGLHLVHRLYGRRENLRITVGEAHAWMRTYFEDYDNSSRESRTVPVWGLIDAKDPQVEDYLVQLACADNGPAARGCLRYATQHRLRPQGLWPPPPSTTQTVAGEVDNVATLTDVRPEVQSWRRLFKHFSGVDIALNYMVTVATSADIPFIASIAEDDNFDEVSRAALLIVASVLSGTSANIEALCPSRYAANTEKIAEFVSDSIPTLSAEALGRVLSNSNPFLAALAACEIARSGTFTSKQLKDAVSLHNPGVEDAIVERSSMDTSWGLEVVESLKKIEGFQFKESELIARAMSACMSCDTLQELDSEERLSNLPWGALMVQDSAGRIQEARAVLQGIHAPTIARIEPLQRGHATLAAFIEDDARRIACSALERASSGTPGDVMLAAQELRRDAFQSRESALCALISLTADNPQLANLAEIVGDLKVLDGYWAISRIDAVLDSRLAELVAPIWLASERSEFRNAARRRELTLPSTTDSELEQELYVEPASVRMGALDELLRRWESSQLLELLNRYSDQSHQYWYSIVAALDDHLFGIPAIHPTPALN